MKTRLLTGLMSALILTGCSVYHDARSGLPADPKDRVSLRLQHAQQAERKAVEAVESWFREPVPPPESSLDRVEVQARELERRVLAIRDTAAAHSLAGPDADEAARLEERTTKLLDAVRDAREGNMDAARESIASWLRASSGQKESRGASAAACGQG